jgi:hypothetical protein
MFLLADLHFSTENSTGRTEVRKIDVPVTDLNNINACSDTEEFCVLDIIYYFIIGECICFFCTE